MKKNTKIQTILLFAWVILSCHTQLLALSTVTIPEKIKDVLYRCDSPDQREHDKNNLEDIVAARTFDSLSLDPNLTPPCSVMLDLPPIDYKEHIDDVVNFMHQYLHDPKYSWRNFLTILSYIHGYCDGTWQARGEISAQQIIKYHSSLLVIKGMDKTLPPGWIYAAGVNDATEAAGKTINWIDPKYYSSKPTQNALKGKKVKPDTIIHTF